MKSCAFLCVLVCCFTHANAALPNDIGGITIGSSKASVVSRFGKQLDFDKSPHPEYAQCGVYTVTVYIEGKKAEFEIENNIVTSGRLTVSRGDLDLGAIYDVIVKKYGAPHEKTFTSSNSIDELIWYSGNQQMRLNSERFAMGYKNDNDSQYQFDKRMKCLEARRGNALPNF
jgi:hypothetical protein